MRKGMLVGLVAVCSALFVSTAMAAAGDAWIGTWKMNTAKSKSNGPAAQSSVLVEITAVYDKQ